MTDRWGFGLRCYYGKRATLPRVPGELAIETVHRGVASRDIEIDAAKSRRDIGRIEVRDRRTDGPWEVVYAEVPGNEWSP